MAADLDPDKTVPFKPRMTKEEADKVVRTGKIMTHFQLEKKLGEGGMGTVYLGTDVTLDRPVAIKFMNHTIIRKSLRMNPNLSDKDRSEAVGAIEGRFIREAKSAASINHPNLAQIYEANFDTDDWYIAMEYVDGDSLAGLLAKDQTFTIGQILTIFKQTVEGLKHAWDNYKIVHRDIKPANIMVTPKGLVKIVDLGLAKPVGGGQEIPDVTGGGMPIGTPAYMAPEQARGDEDVDFRTDVFALGATIYELCAKQKAFAGNTPAQVYHCQVKREYKSLLEVRPETPRPLVKLIESMMAPDSANRPKTYDGLLDEIKRLERDSSSSITTLVGLVTKEVRRLQSVDFSRLFPWKPLTSGRFWTHPLTIVAVVVGLLPVFLLKSPPRPARLAWLWTAAAALLWGVLFMKYLRPDQALKRGMLRAVGLTAVVAVPIVIILAKLKFSKEYFARDYYADADVSVWKLILTVGLIEEVLKLVGVWFLPKFIRDEPKPMDYCMVGIASGLVFAIKSGIVYTIVLWDFPFNRMTTITRLTIFIVATPLLHACWTGVSARFVAMARETRKVEAAPLILGILLVAVLHGLWLAFPCTYWSLLVAAVSILFFLSCIAYEKDASLEKTADSANDA